MNGFSKTSADDRQARWRNRDWLDLSTAPYSIVGAPDGGGPRKRYLHCPAHGVHSARELIEALCTVSRLERPEGPYLDLWDRLERGAPPAFSAGAIQVRDGGADLSTAKTYLKPRRLGGLGIRLAAMTLGKEVDRLHPGMGEVVRREIIRRDEIDEIFYVAVSMRPDLEIETYHDIEFRRSAYLAEEVRNISRGLAMHREIARRAQECVAAMAGLPLACNHISCDLWPLGEGGVTVVLSPKEGDIGELDHHYEAVRRILALPGSAGRAPETASEMKMMEGLAPSVVAVKIAPHGKEVRHAVFVEEVNPDFAEML